MSYELGSIVNPFIIIIAWNEANNYWVKEDVIRKLEKQPFHYFVQYFTVQLSLIILAIAIRRVPLVCSHTFTFYRTSQTKFFVICFLIVLIITNHKQKYF
jgi:hypothetical protein